MNALIAKERYHFHEKLFETNTLTLTKANVASNADTSSRGSKAIAKRIVDILVEEQQHKINVVEKISGQTLGKQFEMLTMEFLQATFPYLQNLYPGKWSILQLGNNNKLKTSDFEQYQSLINILKSNVSLMIYNIIEYTVTNLIDSIYDEIRVNHLSYIDVNDSIRNLWRKTILRSVNDPNANFSTFLRKNEEIISAILSNNELNMYAKNTLPGGNLDGTSIKETFESHGIQVRTSSRNYRPDILIGIKENRNNLAHGSVSFVEAMREDSIDDIRANESLVVGFLEELIETVSTYIEDQKYKKV